MTPPDRDLPIPADLHADTIAQTWLDTNDDRDERHLRIRLDLHDDRDTRKVATALRLFGIQVAINRNELTITKPRRHR